MAVGTTSPVKILLDLGIDLDNLSSEEDYLSALKEGAAILQVGGKTDERFSILADEVRRVRAERKEADPTFKTRKVSVDKLFDRKQIQGSQNIQPKALLPAASEKSEEKDQTIITSNLADRLDNINEALKGLSLAFKQKLRLDKKASEIDARNAKEADKLAREKKLETKKKISTGFGFKKLIRPATGFFDTLKRFFGNVLAGSILLGLLKWIQDPKNKDGVQKFTDFFTKSLPLILGGIVALVALNILSPILALGGILFWGANIVGGALGFLGRRLFPPKPIIPPPNVNLRKGIKSQTLLNKSKGIKPRVIGGGKGFKATQGRAPLIPKPTQGITPKVNTIPKTSKLGMLKNIPFRRVSGILRTVGLGFLIAELKGDWDRGDYYAVGSKLTAYGAGWLVTALGLTAGAAAGVTGVGTVPGIAVMAGSGAAGMATDMWVRNMLLGNRQPQTTTPSNITPSPNAKISPHVHSQTPALTSPTGTGNIQFLDLRGGGGQQALTVSGGEGGGEEVPTFSSQDPNNLSTVTVRSVYGLVN